MNLIAVILIFVLMLCLLLFVRTKNSTAYKKNSNPFIFRLAVAVWATASLVDVYQSSVPIQHVDTKTKAVTVVRKRPNFSFVISGLMIISAIYMMGKSEWGRMMIDGIGAWKGKDIDNSTETLVEHGLKNPNDRRFVLEVLRIKFGKDLPSQTLSNIEKKYETVNE